MDVVVNIMYGLTSPLADVAIRLWQVVQPVLAQWKGFITEVVVSCLMFFHLPELMKLTTSGCSLYYLLSLSTILNFVYYQVPVKK